MSPLTDLSEGPGHIRSLANSHKYTQVYTHSMKHMQSDKAALHPFVWFRNYIYMEKKNPVQALSMQGLDRQTDIYAHSPSHMQTCMVLQCHCCDK